MAFTYQQIIESEWQDIQAEHAYANAELERARVVEDADGVRAATARLYDLDNRSRSLGERARQMQTPAREMPGAEEMTRADAQLAKHYGLSAHQLSIAKGWTGATDMTDEAKVRTYLENKQRLAQARTNGDYRDDQGRVTR
jgi:hypothetical protein